MSREAYHRYLASRDWQLRRRAVRQRANNTCERCRSAPLEAVHHVTYIRLFHERLEDLQGLCDPCHRFVSGVSDDDPIDRVVHATRQRLRVLEAQIVASNARIAGLETKLLLVKAEHARRDTCLEQEHSVRRAILQAEVAACEARAAECRKSMAVAERQDQEARERFNAALGVLDWPWLVLFLGEETACEVYADVMEWAEYVNGAAA